MSFKKILVNLGVALAAFAFIACGGGSEIKLLLAQTALKPLKKRVNLSWA